MSQTTDRLQVEITATDIGLRDGFIAAGAQVREFGAVVDAGHRGTGQAAASAAKEHRGFIDVLKEFKAEQVQQGRTASFFASQLAEIIPGAQGAAGALKGLISVGLEGLAGGFGIGAGVEAAIFVLGQLKESFLEHEERLKALRKTSRETWNEYSDSMDAVARSLQGKQTEALKAWSDSVIANTRKMRSLREEMGEVARGDAIDRSIIGDIAEAWTDIFGGKTKKQEKLDQLAGQVVEIGKSGPASDAGVAVLGEVQSKEEIERARETAAAVLEIETGLARDEYKIWLEHEGKLAEIAQHSELSEVNRAALRVAADKEQDQKLRAIAHERRVSATEAFKELEERERQSVANKAKAEAEKREIIRKHGEKIDADNEKRDKEIQAKMQRVLVDAASIGGGLASAWAGTLKGMLTGTESFASGVEKIFRELADQVISMILEMAAKWFVFNAISGIVNIASGGTAGAAFGAIGLSDLLPSFRAEGGPVSAGRSYIVGEKGPERFVPSTDGTVVPNHALAAGSMHLHFHGPVYDAGGVRALASDPDFIAGWREARRNGRI